jgi:starvation-inducible DNA-binding protein
VSSHIKMDKDNCSQMVSLLNGIVIGLSDLRIQVKLAHWNVRGPQFLSLHEFFDRLAGHLDAAADTVAERVAALGGVAGAPVGTIAENTPLPKWDVDVVDERELVGELIQRLALIANAVRGSIGDTAALGDPDAADVLTEISRQLDKYLWMLQATRG